MSAITRAFQTVATPIPNTVWTPLSFGNTRWNEDGLWVAGAPTRLTCVVAGLHIATGTVGLSAGGTVNACAIRLNGAPFISDDGLTNVQGETCAMWRLAVGDWLELCAYQNSGAAQTATLAGNYAGEFSVCRV